MDLAGAGQAQGAWLGHPSDPSAEDPRSTLRISGSGPPDPGYSGSGTKQNGEYFCHFYGTGGTRKTAVFRQKPDPDHTVFRELPESGGAGFRPISVISGTCPGTRIPGIPVQFCQKCRLAPPEFPVFPEMAGNTRKVTFSGCHFPARSQLAAARAELKSSLLTDGESRLFWISERFHSI